MKYIRVLVMMMALMWGAVSGAWAQLTASDIEYEVKPSASGTIEKSVNATTREVTLTVKPETGYFIKASDFVVEKLVNTGNANAPKRRVSDITDLIKGKLYKNDMTAEISSVSAGSTAKYVFTLPADYDGAYVTARFHLEEEGNSIRITRNTSLGENPDMSKHYVLVEDVSATVVDVFYSKGTFTGTFEGEAKVDGSFPTISGLEHALFQTVDGGTVKNIVLDNVTIAGSTYYTSVTVSNQSKKATGAIANVATGASRIYNCGIQATGSSVTTDKDGYTLFSTVLDAEKKPQHTESSSTVGGVDYVGGLVGFLDGTARVINCYSYADITSGSVVGGIVGRNNVATTAANLQTMVMNCMFYGNLTSGNKAPIYNGVIITNRSDQSGVSNFNYFWAGAPYVQNRVINTYNCALSAETRFLQRFEFFRHLLNGHRELAAWWVQGTGFDKNEMAKWVMEPSQIGTTTPYPILKAQGKYPSVVNYEPSDVAIDANNEHRNEGRKLGTLSVTIRMGTNSPYDAPEGAQLKSGQSMTLSLPITDKDPARFNFNYGKVQLPYYNDYGIGNYTGNRVVTGWKIVAISGGTHGFSTGDDATASVNDNGDITLTTPYNFADRKCTDKDKFEVSGRVFSQGAYFDVPEGVSSIIIEPYWAKAVFVADDYRDVVFDKDMSNKYDVGAVGGGQWFNVGTGANVSHDFTFNGEGTLSLSVHNTLANAVTTLFSGETTTGRKPYDYAVVLVGNVHSLDLSDAAFNENNKKTRPYTIMSIDLDKDNEPDYSYILRFNSRLRVHPVRVDFLNIPGLGMAQKSTGGSGTYNFGILQPLGLFESTNTSLFRFTQFEYDKKNRVNSPMILQGGVIEQWVTVGGSEETHQEGRTVSYYHVGGNVWFKEFHIGVHQDKNTITDKNPNPDQFVSPHPPISVTGGDFDEFYLTGLYNTPNNNSDDNAECYINGGRFGKVCGTGMQGIGGFTKNDQGVKISYSNGNIIWQIDNADIDEFYAGGINAAHIAEGNITTVISNSRVDQFCGGPKFGNMNNDKNVATNATNCTFRTFFGAGYGGNSYNRRYPYNKNGVTNLSNPTWNGWVSTEYTKKYDSNYGGVETRIDYQFIPMSSNTNNVARLFVDYVSFSLATTHYVTSKLTGCTITTSPLGRLKLFDQCLGNFYGGGSLGKVTHDVKSTLTNCTVEGNVFGGGYSASLPPVDVMSQAFQTEPYYDSNLGAYLEAKLPATESYTWEQANTVNSTATAINTGTKKLYTTEDLTGLGKVEGNVFLNIDGNTTLTDGKMMSVTKSVYGGGEESNVAGNTQVNITGGTITQNVFGGGKGEADEFTCSKAMVGEDKTENACENPSSDNNKDKGTKVTISNGIVNGNVYGGGEVGRVEWNTQVKIGVGTGDGPFAPEINGSVFGAGKGKETHGYAALVRGNSSVTIQGNAKVRDNVYGGGEQATVGRYWVKGIPTTLCTDEGTQAPEAPSNTPDEMPYKTRRGGKCTVVVQGSAQVGPNGGATETAGHVFGAGKGVTPNYNNTPGADNRSKRMVDYNSGKHTGDPGTTWDYSEAYTEAQKTDENFKKYVWEYFTTEDKYFEFLQTLALVTGTDVTIGGTAVVKGSVYGGSESGYVQDDTDVKVNGGTIGTTDLGGAYYGNVYGGGKGDAEHTGTNQNYVAAGLVKGNTKVTISNGTILHNVYGGGAYGSVGQFTYDATGMPTGRVENTTGGKAEVVITGGTFGTTGSSNGMIFGSSRGDVGAEGSIHDKLAWVYETDVKIGTSGSGSVFTTPTVKGSVYGGGENGHVFRNADVYIYSGTVGIPTGEEIDNQSGASYPYRGNVYGAGCGTDKYYTDLTNVQDPTDGNGVAYNPLAGIVQGNTTVNISGGHVVRNVYGAGAMGSVGTASDATSGKTTITVTGGRIGYNGNSNNDGNIFGAARGDLAATGDNLAQVRETEVNISYTTTPTADNEDKNVQLIAGSVFGGGEAGKVKGSVAVNMTGGLILKDLYGGGALADTQTSNWDASANNNAGGWADADKKSALHTTTVRLTGGRIGEEVFGGALGEAGTQQNPTGKPAYVWGDVLVDLNGTTTMSNGKATTNGTTLTGNAKGCIVNQVFGCNNINGTPKGDVMVHVFATQNAAKDAINGTVAQESEETDKEYLQRLINIAKPGETVADGVDATAIASAQTAHNSGTDAEITAAITAVTAELGKMYDVQAVYGGGNNAAYVPVTAYTESTATGSKAQVVIEGCDYTSIQYVYGGGNAAPVPDTYVLVKGTKIIDYVFGGGNGTVSAADVGYDGNGNNQGDGNANTTLMAGTIHNVYGASNTNGDIRGKANITKVDKSNDASGCCDKLVVNKMYSAGKDADISGGSKVILGCMEDDWIEEYYGGAENANVLGDVELTITSGKFRKVFGGNKTSGAIFGHIKVNIEETGCIPIEIDELYGCGNEAPYSIYGYSWDGTSTNPNNGKKIFTARTSASDGTPVKPDGSAYPNEGTGKFTAYDSPEVNIISATRIGKVFGGGLGANAIVYGNPTVNINMIKGTATGSLSTLGMIGDVFGGGNAADVFGNATVNIGTETKVQLHVSMNDAGVYTMSEEKDVEGANIKGNVYGGGNEANITGDTYVNICAKEVTSGTTTTWQKVTYGTGLAGVSIDKKSDDTGGSVFGGGCSADVLGNTNVRMSDGYVFNGIFGGGYAGNVGTFIERSYTEKTDVGTDTEYSSSTHTCIGKPTKCKTGTGKCTVVVDGGQIGPYTVATLGMNRPKAQGGPVPEGWVWGAGQGLIEDPAKEPDTHFKSYVGSTDVTIGGTAFVLESIIGGGEFGRVLGDTKVTITGNCQIGIGAGKVDANNKPIRYTDAQFVNPLTTTITNDIALAECSHFPYGNSSNEYLPYDPYYDDNKTYADAHNLGPASTSNPSDGKTWIGCVFAGGSGYMPYLKKDNNGNPVGYDWCSSAGLVEGDTEVRISGGHILTNVYGGNEVTNVKGKCKVTMTGGTIGVPRTVQQIIDHPLTCYLFGAGKGDPRPHFNTETNVGEVEINISGGIIYGSVFGGGEDGHVQRDVNLTIEKGEDFTIGGTTYSNGPVIGTWGTTYVDGNVFGGGRGFAGDAYTAGNVAGCVDLDIKGGNILGSIYGGGRLGSVGYGLYPPTAGDTYYGAMRPDNTGDDANNTAIADFKRGYVDVEISGGTIGNTHEYIIPSSANTPTGLSFAGIATWSDDDWKTWGTHNNIPLTEFDHASYRLKHTKGGNVFTGGMGRLYQLDGTPISTYNENGTLSSPIEWTKLGNVKSTKLTVKGGTIKSNVYGGGELGAVKPYVNGTVVQGGTTEIIIKNENNTQIGTEVKDGSNTQYTFGSVYGGGYGSTIENFNGTDNTNTENDNPKFVAGLVHGDTEIDMQGGKVLASVYGGGEVASVNGKADVAVSGGEVGKDKVGNQQFGGATMGNVYGGGSGNPNIVRCGRILKNTKVTISGANTKIYHNVYGGGAYGTVGDFNYTTDPDDHKVIGVESLKTEGTGTAEVIITGGTIGTDGHNNGMVFGSSRGDINKTGERDDHTAWVYDAKVTIGTQGSETGPAIKGSIYGSGENGHTFNNAEVTVHSGIIGVTDDASYLYRGNVYGGGCGTDKYFSNTSLETHNGNGDTYNPLAGIVYGNTTVNIDGGTVVRNVYGAGAMGSVGNKDANGAIIGGGKTTINVSGGTIGVSGTVGDGNVYGAARGDINDNTTGLSEVQETEVNIKPNAIDGKPEATIKGSVFGGGEAGIVKGAVAVSVSGGNVLNDVYGGGALADTNTDNWGTTTWADTNKKSSVYTTAVNLTGGTVTGNVYGGGLGRMAVGESGQTGYVSAIEAKVYGNTTVELNNGVADNAKGCIVEGSIFGCNNMSGSPQGATTVHIYKTQRKGATRITNTTGVTNAKEQGTKTNGEYNPGSFDVKAVYGGGNMAAFEPVDLTTGTTNVIIDGCERTSICHVYGGGNAASTPATNVTINGTYEIGELFGGGNGKDDIVKNNVTLPNPGANVGYKDYTVYTKDGDDWVARDSVDFDTKEKRTASTSGITYGTGVATVNVFGGLVHRVFGGSNTKGNVRQTALTLLDENNDCPFCVDEAYGGGKSAEMDAEAKLLMACIPGLEAAYGGAEAADVHGNVTLNITNGTFDRVFGGNNLSGTISGAITVNIEEVGCRPIIIGELYGGGNQAGYSVYGYNDDDTPKETGSKLYEDPQVNVMSFTSIGKIFGGGYGSGATLVGNPTVSVNEVYGRYYNQDVSVVGEDAKTREDGYSIPSHAKGKMGAISEVFGGGNAAKVIGNTTVNIATAAEVYIVKEVTADDPLPTGCYTRSGEGTTASPFVYTEATGAASATVTYYEKKPVVGVDIRGNVYGGGNNAEVTGNTNVNIGKRAE